MFNWLMAFQIRQIDGVISEACFYLPLTDQSERVSIADAHTGK